MIYPSWTWKNGSFPCFLWQLFTYLKVVFMQHLQQSVLAEQPKFTCQSMFYSSVVISFLCSTQLGRCFYFNQEPLITAFSGQFSSLAAYLLWFFVQTISPSFANGRVSVQLTEVKINAICGSSSICKACYPVLKALQVVQTVIASDKSV